jgi:hypothetical protein
MEFIKLNKYNTNTTKLNIKNGVPYISFSALDRIGWIKNGFSTRIGGVSTEHLYSLNLGFSRGDKEENVKTNHEIIAKAIGFSAENIVSSHQTHTTNVRVVTKADCGKGIYRPRDYEDVDGMITNEKEVVLATYFADCVPLYMVDTKNKAIGLSHSGWRGTVGKMGKVTLEKMKETYGTNPRDVVACIGPSICRDCYEVSEDVAMEFKSVFPENISEILTDKGNGKYQLDLWQANRLVFQEAGVRKENIFVTDICTCCNTEVLYSHRGHHGKRGNLAAFLTLI